MTPIDWLFFALLLSAKALLVLAVAFGVTRLMRDRSAAERHLVWMLASVCVLALPALSLAGPVWRVDVPHSWVNAIERPFELVFAPEVVPAVEAETVVEVAPIVARQTRRERVSRALGTPALAPAAEPIHVTIPPSTRGRGGSAAVEVGGGAAAVWVPAEAGATAGGTGSGSGVTVVESEPTSPGPAEGSVVSFILLLTCVTWLTGTAVVLGRIVTGFISVHRLAREARPLLDPVLLVRAHGIAAEIGVRRPIRFLEGDVAAMPITFGVLRPTLLLPSGAGEWTGSRQNAVLRHELEHVRRRDSLSQLVAELGCAMYWFNPLMWWASRRMCIEREHACDDAVLAAGSRPSDYAAELLDIARTLKSGHVTAVAAIAMARRSHLRARVSSLLDSGQRRQRTSTKLRVPAWTGAFLLITPLSSLAFEFGGRLGPASEDLVVEATSQGSPAHAAEAGHESSGASNMDVAAPPAWAWLMAVDTPPPPPAPLPPTSPIMDPTPPMAWPVPPGMVPAPAPLPWASAVPMLHWASPVPIPDVPAPMALPSPPAIMPAPAAMPWASPAPLPDVPAAMPMQWSSPGAPTPPPPPAPAPFSYDGGPGGAFGRMIGAGGQDCLTGDLSNVSTNANNDRRATTWSGDDCSGEIIVEGDIEFNADFTSIVGISRGGRVRITTEEDGVERRVTITPANGGVAYDYQVDGDRREFDAEGQQWLSSTLLFMFRRFGFMADERAESMLRRGGVDAVLTEVGLMGSDFVRSRYLRVVVESGQLDAASLNRVLTLAGDMIDSDHYRTQIITSAAGRYEFTDDVRNAYIDAVAGIDSDHYMHAAFSTLLEEGRLTPAQASAVLGETRRIDSDHYRAQLLDEMAATYASTPGIREAYLDAAADIDSDHYKTAVLTHLFAVDGMTDAEVARVVDAAATIDSDHYRATVLGLVERSGLHGAALQSAFVRTAGGIDSDHYLHSVLAQIADRDDLDNATLLLLLTAADGIDSDHYMSQLLVQIAQEHRLEGEARTRFESLMRQIESGTWRGRVAEALLENGS